VCTVSAVGVALFDQWAEEYLAADELEQRMVAAAVRCVARWGLAKTSLDDIAREAGSSRATAYRVFPGGIALRMLTGHEALTYMLRHEPELVLPHFAFHRLDRLFMYSTELSRPHLARFLPDDDIAPAAELVARVVLSYAFRPSDAVDHRDPDSIRRLVRTYLLPALTPGEQP